MYEFNLVLKLWSMLIYLVFWFDFEFILWYYYNGFLVSYIIFFYFFKYKFSLWMYSVNGVWICMYLCCIDNYFLSKSFVLGIYSL